MLVRYFKRARKTLRNKIRLHDNIKPRCSDTNSYNPGEFVPALDSSEIQQRKKCSIAKYKKCNFPHSQKRTITILFIIPSIHDAVVHVILISFCHADNYLLHALYACTTRL